LSNFQWVAVAIITILSAARVTRLLTFDTFPPIKWVRDEFIEWTDKTPMRRSWQLLAYCGYCMSFWVTVAIVLWGYYSHWNTVWLLVNAVFGASYVAAIIMVHDGDNDEVED
jgi:hypothetical protein